MFALFGEKDGKFNFEKHDLCIVAKQSIHFKNIKLTILIVENYPAVISFFILVAVCIWEKAACSDLIPATVCLYVFVYVYVCLCVHIYFNDQESRNEHLAFLYILGYLSSIHMEYSLY